MFSGSPNIDFDQRYQIRSIENADEFVGNNKNKELRSMRFLWNENAKNATTFIMRTSKKFCNDENYFIIESALFPNRFIRHHKYQVKIDKNTFWPNIWLNY